MLFNDEMENPITNFTDTNEYKIDSSMNLSMIPRKNVYLHAMKRL